MKNIKKSLEIIALKNSEGLVSDDILIKACDIYKIKADDFIDDYDYNVRVTKSLFDYLNESHPDEEVCKAVVPGQTKIVDGVMYIYTATPNAKTAYDWRVYQGNKKIGRQVSDDKVESKQKYINELFPTDLSTLKVIKRLGGSTGAQLVEDAKGNQFVMKRGGNTTNEHVRSEYLTNQLYDLLGQRVPDYELYDDKGEVVMLSKFIPMTKMPDSSHYDEMAKGFVVDALLANWDIYQNDNCLVDSAGRIIRVDNGGALEYRAQGSKKNFGRKVDDFKSMQRYNPSIVANLTYQDYIDQIDEILKKSWEVIHFLNENNLSSLSSIFTDRFKDLEDIRFEYVKKINKKNRQVLPRNLKSDSEMYREFTEDELKEFWSNQSGSSYYAKIGSTKRGVGWELLNSICEERGFTARPNVVEEDEYWELVKKSKYQMFRGLSPGRDDVEIYMDSFKYDDSCFYGTIGAHGAGIYAHVNDGKNNSSNTKTSYKSSDAYGEARSYATMSGDILEMVLDDSAKVGKVDDLRKEILNLSTSDSEEVKNIQSEIDGLNTLLQKQESDLNNVTKTVEEDIKKDMHWDEDTLIMYQVEIDNVNWGKLDEHGDADYPSFGDFVINKMTQWVISNGGTVRTKGDTGKETCIFSLPNSKEKFMLSRYQWENNAIKRKNAFSRAYNYPLTRFQDWLMKEHYTIIDNKVKKELEHLNDTVNKMNSDIRKTKNELNNKDEELNEINKVKNPDADIMSGIRHSVNHGNSEAIGIYAALKGYDAIIQPRGNGGPNSFMIILNRSKVSVKK